MPTNAYDDLILAMDPIFYINWNNPNALNTAYEMDHINVGNIDPPPPDSDERYYRSFFKSQGAGTRLSNTDSVPVFSHTSLDQTLSNYGWLPWAGTDMINTIKGYWTGNTIGDLTLAAWFKPTQTATGDQWIFRLGSWGFGLIYNKQASDAARLYGQIYDTSNTQRLTNYFFQQPTNRWHLGVVTKTALEPDPDTGFFRRLVRVYVDGDVDPAETEWNLNVAVDPNKAQISNFTLGYDAGQIKPFLGKIGPMGLWNRALSAAEINALWAEGIDLDPIRYTPGLRTTSRRGRTDYNLIPPPDVPVQSDLDLSIQTIDMQIEDSFVSDGQLLVVSGQLLHQTEGQGAAPNTAYPAYLIDEVDGVFSADFAGSHVSHWSPEFVSQTFTTNTDWVVPTGVTSVNVQLQGASGGLKAGQTTAWPYGVRFTQTIAVTPGETLRFTIGGEPSGSTGGANGGGNGTDGGMGGGGATDVRRTPFALANRLATAPGGGGAGAGTGGGTGGPGSWLDDSTFAPFNGFDSTTGLQGGRHGKTTSGGAGGVTSGANSGTAGTLGQGGNGGAGGGGGGGGGQYGGGGGAGLGGEGGGGGGGGTFDTISSYGNLTGPGQATVSWVDPSVSPPAIRSSFQEYLTVIPFSDRWFMFVNTSIDHQIPMVTVVDDDPFTTTQTMYDLLPDHPTDSTPGWDQGQRGVQLDASNIAVIRPQKTIHEAPLQLYMLLWNGSALSLRTSTTIGGGTASKSHGTSNQVVHIQKIGTNDLLIMWHYPDDFAIINAQVVTYNTTTGTFTPKVQQRLDCSIGSEWQFSWWEQGRILLLTGFDWNWTKIRAQTIRVENDGTMSNCATVDLDNIFDDGAQTYSLLTLGKDDVWAVVYSRETPDRAPDTWGADLVYQKIRLGGGRRNLGGIEIYEAGLIEPSSEEDREMYNMSSHSVTLPDGRVVGFIEHYFGEDWTSRWRLIIAEKT